MTPEQQLSELRRGLRAGTPVWAVHYSCEGFYGSEDHPPAVSAISLAPVPLGAEKTFSCTSGQNSKEAERLLLQNFFEFLKNNPDARLVHWNMNKTEFGFSALADRYVYLTGEKRPPLHAEERVLDLDDMIADQHGADYAPHPHLANLMSLNNISSRYS